MDGRLPETAAEIKDEEDEVMPLDVGSTTVFLNRRVASSANFSANPPAQVQAGSLRTSEDDSGLGGSNGRAGAGGVRVSAPRPTLDRLFKPKRYYSSSSG